MHHHAVQRFSLNTLGGCVASRHMSTMAGLARARHFAPNVTSANLKTNLRHNVDSDPSGTIRRPLTRTVRSPYQAAKPARAMRCNLQQWRQNNRSMWPSKRSPAPGLTIRNVNVTYPHPSHVQESEFSISDPGRANYSDYDIYPSNASEFPWYWEILSRWNTLERDPSPIRSTSFLPCPKHPNSLEQNLLLLASYKGVGLPALVDYHDLYSSLKSTQSFNFLIGLSLRHASFGTTKWLMRDMEEACISGNLETEKLKIRWLVLIGQWEEAWERVMGFPANSAPDVAKNRGIPIPFWLELFQTTDRASLRSLRRTRYFNSSGSEQELLPLIYAQEHKPHVLRARQILLLKYPPSAMPETLMDTPPRPIYQVVNSMLKSMEMTTALSFAKLYLSSLPRLLKKSWIPGLLAIIHLVMMRGFTKNTKKKGPAQFYEGRRTLFALLKQNRSLRPNSSTLFLLLSLLRPAKNCGSLALCTVRQFKDEWGACVEDRRVMRRIGDLALKEGRMDILNRMLMQERSYQQPRSSWMFEKDVLGDMHRLPPFRRLLRAPFRKTNPSNGMEGWKWYLLRRRMRHKRLKREERENVSLRMRTV